jgi:desulfoferrodoxin-like iron-binding protein
MVEQFVRAVLIVSAAAILPIAAAGCGKSEEQPKAAAAEGTAVAAPAEGEQATPYTKDFLGPWNADVAKVHLPQITYEKAGEGLNVTVKVDDHPMNPDIPHYIMWIRIEDGEGNILGKKDFVATDPAPIAAFSLKTAPEKIRAFERCNIHGIWMSETDVK